MWPDSVIRLLLKQLITMEVIQWTALWNTFKEEFDNEKNMLGGSLADKAAEDLRLRVIEHVISKKSLICLICLIFIMTAPLEFTAVIALCSLF